ncbi:S-adenosyl-L-methionine-dependent methyltransferase [Cristinia sonorae]|uniref:S-adenosyl-L-methionine-dependent methyltransferase n=1 Tax=Cristinia sonorae TaxID=1940300 RepID=A0A8K0UXI9_9AGAR|nr:S-adenosyl-L-methionine-dependent methyltransferase [Cristinia sonorae]
MATVHKVAQDGFGTGTNELYDRARPSYQPFVLSHIRSVVRGTAPLNILEIGAGTGIFTRALLAHPEWKDSVAELRAVEPSEGMRAVFTKTVVDPRVSAVDGTFDSTGVEDGWADVVIAAQAYHWCPDYDKASAEFARALKPNGVVVLVWNLEDREGAPWVAQLRDTYEKFENGTPQFRLGLWRATFSTPGFTSNFESPPSENRWKWNLTATRDLVIDRALSKSYVAILPPDEKEQVKKDIGVIVDRGDGLTWVDKDKGTFEYPYYTMVVAWKKK